jgi:hypothetical protein
MMFDRFMCWVLGVPWDDQYEADIALSEIDPAFAQELGIVMHRCESRDYDGRPSVWYKREVLCQNKPR